MFGELQPQSPPPGCATVGSKDWDERNISENILLFLLEIITNFYIYRCLEDEIKDFNLDLAYKQKKNQDYLNNVFYKNKTSDEFYEQFNKTTR